MMSHQPESSWSRHLSEFCALHRRGLNIAIHLFTTPLGIVGVLAVIHSLSPAVAFVVVAAYSLQLLALLPLGVALRATAAIGALLGLAIVLEPGVALGAVLVAVAYVLQDFAHYLADEPSLQSTYQGVKGWPARLLVHTNLLLPLVIECARLAEEPPMTALVPRSRILACTLDAPAEREDIEFIAAFVEAENPTRDHTTHWWQRDLPADVQERFARLAGAPAIRDGFRQTLGDAMEVETVDAMNELYVTGPPQQNTSDTVFYTPHIDGPFAVYPFASVFRCMLGASPNTHVRTHFPLNDGADAPGHLLSTGQSLAFDFNREPHYITSDPEAVQAGRRINLKLHYLAYPRRLPRYGRLLARLNSVYDDRARALFLRTIQTTSVLKSAASSLMLLITRSFVSVEHRAGWNSVAYVGLLALLCLSFGNYPLFLMGTSFVHYFLYLAVLRHPRHVCHGRLVRNVVFYKALALLQLAALYVRAGDFNPLSVAVIVTGFGIAGAAFIRLGTLRTYFGAEVGRCVPQRVSGFPYNVLPHPMVLGSMLGLIGFHLSQPLRAEFYWLVPAHLLAYLLYLAEEIRRQPRVPQPSEPAREEGSRLPIGSTA